MQIRLDRASRDRGISGLGPVEVAAPTRSQPRQPKATPVPPKKVDKPAAKKPATKAPVPPPVKASGNLQAVVNFALAQVGDSYQWGATGPDRWDCSAITMAAYARIGIKLPHQSEQQMRYGRPVSRSDLKPGDLIFWNGHVALSLGGNALVHAANPRVGVVRGTIYGSPIGYRRLVG